MSEYTFKQSDLDRLASKIVISDDSECWGWTDCHFPTGYAQMWLSGKTISVHRFVCFLWHGPSAGLYALHSCDNRGCVNPSHLRWGTPADNMADRSLRDRAPRGEGHPNAKLTQAEVQTIRELHATGTSQSELARTYGVTRQAVWRIVKGRVWAVAA